MAFPLGRLTVSAYFHAADEHVEPLPNLSGSFEELTISGSAVRGKHVCPEADLTGFFNLEGRVEGNAAILDEAETGLRYTGILVVDALVVQIVFGDFGPINRDDMRERWARLAEKIGLRVDGQEQGTWIATKP